MKRTSSPTRRSRSRLPGHWTLAEARSRFSELVRRAQTDGPQRVSSRGQEVVVIVDASEFERLSGKRTGQLLIDVLQSSPHLDVEIAPSRSF